MKITTNKLIPSLIILWSVVATTLLVYFWSANHKLQKDSNHHLKVVDNCMQSLKASDEIIENCNAAYTEISACFANLDTCNLNESTVRLQSLNEKKQANEIKLKELGTELELLVGEAIGR